MSCNHPDPELCQRLGRHIHGRLWEIWNGVNVDPIRAQQYRELWTTGSVSTRLQPGAPAVVRKTQARRQPPTTHTPQVRDMPCIHLGNDTGKLQECSSCSGNVQIKLKYCEKYFHCSQHKELPEIKCCQTCNNYARYPRITKRNLAYHIYPVEHNDVWRHNIVQLLRRIEIFNNKRLIAIATGPGLDNPAIVKQMFGKTRVEFIEVPNIEHLREVATFLPLFERLESTDADEATFYAHAKGVTRPLNSTIHVWTEMLYETCLDYWLLVDKLLTQFPTAGSFKKIGPGFAAHDSRSQWHYSGSFFWFRHDVIFNKANWREIDQFWAGIEPYLSLHVDSKDAACIFHEKPVQVMQIYPNSRAAVTGWKYVAEILVPEILAWRVANAEYFTPCNQYCNHQCTTLS